MLYKNIKKFVKPDEFEKYLKLSYIFKNNKYNLIYEKAKM